MDPEQFIREKYGPHAKIEKMAGDASDRTFYRIRKGEGSLVVMTYSSPFKEGELPYINIWRFLKKHSFPISQILGIYPEKGILILSDLGDFLLQDVIRRLKESKDHEEIAALYKKGIDIIVDLQMRGTPALDESCFASHHSLDKERFLYELNFFYDHYVKGLLKLTLSKDEFEEVQAWFDNLAEETSSFGKVLCHRDFHSRNLHIHDDALYMTDFQDARFGPYTYDLASFLKDSYAAHEEKFVGEMLEHYLSLSREKVIQRYSSEQGSHLKDAQKNPFFRQFPLGDNKETKEAFRREFDLTCLQRNIKAIGTFAFQSHIKKNHYYLQYIPVTLDYIKRNLKKLHINIPPLNLILDQSAPKAKKS